MGDYARGLVSYTIAIRVSGRLQSRCIRTALCLFVRARRLEHAQREGETEEKIQRGSLRSQKSRTRANFDQQSRVVPPPLLSIRL